MKKQIERALEVLNKVKQVSSSNNVEVIVATKTVPIEIIQQVIANTDIKIAGENRVQELLKKYDSNITWDFIGQLQSNKVKFIVDKVRLIHSVDRLKLLKVINQEAKKQDKIQNILIQLNTGRESNKAGLCADEILPFAKACQEYENINLEGIMAVTPFDIDVATRQKYFDIAFETYNKLSLQFDGIRYLSMGMSNDYMQAIESGANLVRIGSVIFGERQ